jgi:hypothetical protein
VTLCDRIVRVIAALSASDDMSPPSTNLCAGRYSDYRAVLMLDVFVASEGSIADAGDGVVRVWGSDTLELALVCAIDGNFLEDGMARYSACQSSGGNQAELHLEDVQTRVCDGVAATTLS